MKPGTSARNTIGSPNASHSQMKRAALSAESTNSTPPFAFGWFATIPTGWPSIRAKPVISSTANSGLISNRLSASTMRSITRSMSIGLFSCAGICASRSSQLATGATAVRRGGSRSQFEGRYER